LLRSLDDLPAADELRRFVVTKPDSLLTVDPGLATTPPEMLKEEGRMPNAETDSANSLNNSAPVSEPRPPAS